MSKITITDDITYPDGSINTVEVVVTDHGCTVTHLSSVSSLLWENVTDVEYLSEVFANTRVQEFKVIVLLLTKAIALKGAL
jgi:hypothetical protein